jgi:hypothetical protein
MLKDSHYSRSFYSDDLTASKYEEVKSLAESLREVRNEISSLVNKDPLYYQKVSKFEFQKRDPSYY